MKFYKTSDGKKFIATNDSMNAIVTINDMVFTATFNLFPFRKTDGDIYQESTHEEFFNAYDSITSCFIQVAEKKKQI